MEVTWGDPDIGGVAGRRGYSSANIGCLPLVTLIGCIALVWWIALVRGLIAGVGRPHIWLVALIGRAHVWLEPLIRGNTHVGLKALIIGGTVRVRLILPHRLSSHKFRLLNGLAVIGVDAWILVVVIEEILSVGVGIHLVDKII